MEKIKQIHVLSTLIDIGIDCSYELRINDKNISETEDYSLEMKTEQELVTSDDEFK